MNNWTEKEEQLLMNYIEADDDVSIKGRIKFAHYMLYNKKEGAHSDLSERSLEACIYRYYKICTSRN